MTFYYNLLFFIMRYIYFSLIACFLSLSIQAQPFGGGVGSKNDPYRITSKNDLESLREAVNNGNSYHAVYFILTNDIDLRDNGAAPNYEWTPAGLDDARPFCGIFNGNGHTVSNLYIGIQGTQYDRSGLFGTIYTGGQVLNLSLKNGEIRGKINGSNPCTGSMAGMVYCQETSSDSCVIRNCHSEGIRITGGGGGHLFTGGITGYGWSEGMVNIAYCSHSGEVVKGVNSDSYTGGMAGYVYASSSGRLNIQNCSHSGMISGSGDPDEETFAGGIVGSCESIDTGIIEIGNCFNTANIETDTNVGHYAGGIAGLCEISSENAGVFVKKCHNYGVITPVEYSGGIISDVKKSANGVFSVTSCYWNSDDNPGLQGLRTTGTGQENNIVSLTAPAFKDGENFNKNQQLEAWNSEEARWNIGTTGSAWIYASDDAAYPTLKSNNEFSSIGKLPSAGFNVYPTVVKDILIVESTDSAAGIRLYDQLGRLVATHPCRENETLISVSELKSGIYFLRVENRVARFVKE